MSTKETFLFAEPETKPIRETQEVSPEQKLLDWLQRWNKDTICAKNILQFDPNSIRKQKAADNATAILIKHGWLIPTKTKQSNWRRWQIVRKPTVTLR